MKKIFAAFAFAAALSVGTAASLFAKDAPAATTVTGTGKCLKCHLKEADKCQDVIVAKEDGKDVTYIVKGAGHKYCKAEAADAKATGTVSEEGGKKVITAAKAGK
ncbi:MAG TPA: hypothetical protein VF796_04940 [Humisphaera sp.]